MKRIIICFFLVFVISSCIDLGDAKDFKVDAGVKVRYNDPRLRPLLVAMRKINRDSIGFSPLDSNSVLIYKEEYNGTFIKLFSEKSNFLRIVYFEKSHNRVTYSSESEVTKGPRKLTVLDVDGYMLEIQETISIFYDIHKENLAGKNSEVNYLDIDKYLEENPQNDKSIHVPQVIYETEISITEAKEILARWKSGK